MRNSVRNVEEILRLNQEHEAMCAHMLSEIEATVEATGIDPISVVAIYTARLPHPGGGWMAIWGYLRPFGCGEEWQAWRMTQRGAKRTAARKSARLKKIRQAVVAAEMDGS